MLSTKMLNVQVAKINKARKLVTSKMMHVVLVLLTYFYVLQLYCEQLMNYMRKQCSSSVLDMFYIDPHVRVALPLYSPSWPSSIFINWSTWHANHLKSDFAHIPAEDGVYVFRVWNQNTVRYENYMLSPTNLMEALQLRSISAIWALSDVGIVTMLHKYMEWKTKTSCNYALFDMTIDGRSAFHDLRSYMSSILLPNNMNARVLAIWYAFLRWEKGAKDASLAYPFDKASTVTFTDDDLRESVFVDKDPLFATAIKDD